MVHLARESRNVPQLRCALALVATYSGQRAEGHGEGAATVSDRRIDPSTMCDACGKHWSEHWGFNCDKPYANRKFRPLLAGLYPPNRGVRSDEE